MCSSSIEYLQSLVADVPVLDDALSQRLQNWGTGTPPDTIVFGEVGNAIAENLDEFPKEKWRKIFSKIEEGMASPDVSLRTAMATGLVEALVSATDGKPGDWIKLENLLGPIALKHAIAWRSFGS